MGFNNTFEIITKDIQDIEKLVGNFKNYSEIPNIELDLALSKLRNVYDIILLIKEENTDNKTESIRETKHITESESAQPADTDSSEKELHLIQFDNPETENHTEPIPKTVEIKKQDLIVADRFEKEKAYINEKLSAETNNKNISSRLQSSPIQSIAGSIGINDKFMFIRELFGGEAEKFRSTMDILDHAKNFETATEYLRTNFDWKMENDTVAQLMVLVKRKFINPENE